MNKNNNEIFILENYESEFSYKKTKSNLNITFNRIAFIFFVFFMISIIYSIKVFYLGSLNAKTKVEKFLPIKKNYRADILDSSGDFIAKAVNTQIVGINPNLIIDEKKLLIKLQILFPDKDFGSVKKRIKKKKIFSF
jgi:cell division protein FtsI (penicillin-binding protein 3)